MEQNLVKFTLPKGTHVFSQDLRKSVAYELGQGGNKSDQYESLFNYKNGSGENKPSLNRFLGGKGWVGFVSEESPMMVHTVLPHIITTLNKRKINATVQLITQEKSAFVTDEPVVYYLSGAVDKSKIDNKEHNSETDYIKQVIWDMLALAVNQNVLDILPTENELNLTVFETKKTHIPASHDNNEGDLFYRKVSGSFAMNLNLNGIWQAGQLRSRGHGIIYKQNKGGIFN